MKSQSARRIVRGGQDRASERSRGTGRNLLTFAPARAVESDIVNTGRLPVRPNTTMVQNSAGRFLVIPGYSDPAGPDVTS